MKFNCLGIEASMAFLVICTLLISNPSFELRVSDNIDQKRDHQRALSSSEPNSVNEEEQCTGDESDSRALNNHSIVSGYMNDGWHDEPPGWLVTFWSTDRYPNFGYFAGIGTRISDALFIADSDTISRSEQPHRMCHNVENNILTKDRLHHIKTINVGERQVQHKHFSSIRIGPLSKHIALYRFVPMINEKNTDSLNKNHTIFKLEPEDIPLLQSDFKAFNCSLFTYVLIQNSIKAEFKTIPLTAIGVDETTKTYQIHKFTAKDHNFKFCPFMSGSPIFCNNEKLNDQMKLSHISEWSHGLSQKELPCREEFVALRLFDSVQNLEILKKSYVLRALGPLPKH